MAINPIQIIRPNQPVDFVGQFLRGRQFKQNQDLNAQQNERQNQVLQMKQQEYDQQQQLAAQQQQAAQDKAEVEFFGRAADQISNIDKADRAEWWEAVKQVGKESGFDIPSEFSQYSDESLAAIKAHAALKGYQPPKRETKALKEGDTLIDEQTGEVITNIPTSPNSEKMQPVVNNLRSRYDKFNADFRDVDAAFRKVNTAPATAAGDMALIFNYMKMLDPGSTVREGEFANAQNAGGVDDKIVSMYNNIINGQRLTETQRADFKETSKAAFSAQQSAADDQLSNLLYQADQDGVSREKVIGTKALREFEKRAANRVIEEKQPPQQSAPRVKFLGFE